MALQSQYANAVVIHSKQNKVAAVKKTKKKKGAEQPPVQLSGWFMKQPEKTGKPRRRFFVLDEVGDHGSARCTVVVGLL